MDEDEEYEQKLATLERSLQWLTSNRGILMEVLSGPGHAPSSMKAAMGGTGEQEDDEVKAAITEGIKTLGELRSTSTFLIRTLKQRQSGPRMSLGTGLGLDDVVALVGEDAHHSSALPPHARHRLLPHTSPEASAFLEHSSDEEHSTASLDQVDAHATRASNHTLSEYRASGSADPKLLEVIKEGYL